MFLNGGLGFCMGCFDMELKVVPSDFAVVLYLMQTVTVVIEIVHRQIVQRYH